MEKINQFSIERFVLLIKRNVVFNFNTWLVAMGAGTGVIIVVGLIMSYFSVGFLNLKALINLGQVMIFVGGFVLTSLAYNELNNPGRSQFYLTLPATATEKLFSQWLVTSVGFVLLANLLLSVALLLVSALGNLFWSLKMDFFNPFASGNLLLMTHYLVLQSIFFLGAIYFRKNNFLKTILSLFVISMALNMITVVFGLIVFGSFTFQMDTQMMDGSFTSFMENTFPGIMKVLYYGVLAPFCLLVSYFRLKEREV